MELMFLFFDNAIYAQASGTQTHAWVLKVSEDAAAAWAAFARTEIRAIPQCEYGSHMMKNKYTMLIDVESKLNPLPRGSSRNNPSI